MASRGSNNSAWFENANGAGTSWTRHLLGSPARLYWLRASDRDGDIDVVGSGELVDRLYVFENTSGDGSGWSVSGTPEWLDQPLGLEAADLDGDGDDDLLAVGFESDEVISIANGGGQFALRTTGKNYQGMVDGRKLDVLLIDARTAGATVTAARRSWTSSCASKTSSALRSPARRRMPCSPRWASISMTATVPSRTAWTNGGSRRARSRSMRGWSTSRLSNTPSPPTRPGPGSWWRRSRGPRPRPGGCTAGDNCPAVSNASQTNSDAASAGDACQCGNVDGAGGITAADHNLAREAVIKTPGGSFDADFCDVNGDAACDVEDLAVLQRIVNAQPATVQDACPGYRGE